MLRAIESTPKWSGAPVLSTASKLRKKRLAVLATHPIQYHIPWFRALAALPELELQVWFCHRAAAAEQGAAGFGVNFDWDVPLLEGYNYRFLRNVARRPSIHRFGGLDTPEVGDLIRAGRFDAVLVNGWHFRSAWQAIRACWKAQTPVMVRGDSHLHTPRHPLKNIMKRVLYGQFIPRFDACLAVGRWSREYYLHHGARPECIFSVPHTVDERIFRHGSAMRNEKRSLLRKKWMLPDQGTVFLFVGKFIPVKRPLDFARAVALAASHGAPISGLMVGDGPLRQLCEEYVESNRAPVRFTGFLNQSEIANAYLAADVLVLPSEGESWGMVVNEAMACGCPCVVSDRVGSGPDMVVQDQTGTVFPRGDVETLAGLMVRYASAPEKLSSMGALALQKAREFEPYAAVAGTMDALEFVSRGRK